MNTQKANKELKLNNAESDPKDISGNQGVVFHVEHNKQNINKLTIKGEQVEHIRKYKITTDSQVEYLFARSKEQALKLFSSLYPYRALKQLTEV